MNRVCIALLIIINESIIVWTLKTKSLLPSLYKRSRLPRDLTKRGGGRFPEAYVFFIVDSFVAPLKKPWFIRGKHGGHNSCLPFGIKKFFGLTISTHPLFSLTRFDPFVIELKNIDPLMFPI